MGLFRRATPMDRAAVEQLQAELATMKAALTNQRSTTDALARRVRRRPEDNGAPGRLDELAAKVAELEARPSDAPDPARLDQLAAKVADLEARPSDAPDPARLDQLAAKVADLEARPSDAPDPARLDQLAAKVADLEARVTSVSTELANQLTELGHDIDAIGARPPGDGPGEAVLGELRDGQVRLATEQARYQIAFREDLARLAEQLRRPGTA